MGKKYTCQIDKGTEKKIMQHDIILCIASNSIRFGFLMASPKTKPNFQYSF